MPIINTYNLPETTTYTTNYAISTGVPSLEVNNSTTYTSVPGLSIYFPTTGMYQIEAYAVVSPGGLVTATASGLKLRWLLNPSGLATPVTTAKYTEENQTAGPDNPIIREANINQFSFTGGDEIGGNYAGGTFLFKGFLKVTSAGTMSLQAAQFIASATHTMSVRSGYIRTEFISSTFSF